MNLKDAGSGLLIWDGELNLPVQSTCKPHTISVSGDVMVYAYRVLQNGCCEHHLTHKSPFNFDLTLNAHVAEDVARIATLDILNGGSYGVASTGACLQA